MRAYRSKFGIEVVLKENFKSNRFVRNQQKI